MGTTADVAIVGGGIMGCWTALRLVESGLSVVVIERTEIAHEGSGRNRGNVRIQLRDPVERDLINRSLDVWSDIEAATDQTVEYRVTGNLLVTYDADIAAEFREEANRHISLGYDAEVVAGNSLRELVPGISGDVVSGLLTTQDGHINPQLATWHIASKAKSAGVRFLRGCTVGSVKLESGRAVGLETDEGPVHAGQVLVAAGVESPLLLEPLGMKVPIQWALHQVMATAKMPFVTGPYLRCASPRVSFCQTASGTLLLGMAPARLVEKGSKLDFSPEHLANVMRETIRLVPILERAKAVRAWAGVFDMTPDDRPLIGQVEGIDGLFVATGFCGHGFSISPAVTEELARLITGQRPASDLSPFDPRRFERPMKSEAAPEHQSRIAQLGKLTAPSL